jgi:hypothetical protein
LQNSTTISNLKLKASYGELGNNRAQNVDGTGNYFPYLQLFDTGFNELNNTGVVIGGAVDPFLGGRQRLQTLVWNLDCLEIGYLALWIIIVKSQLI